MKSAQDPIRDALWKSIVMNIGLEQIHPIVWGQVRNTIDMVIVGLVPNGRFVRRVMGNDDFPWTASWFEKSTPNSGSRESGL